MSRRIVVQLNYRETAEHIAHLAKDGFFGLIDEKVELYLHEAYEAGVKHGTTMEMELNKLTREGVIGKDKFILNIQVIKQIITELVSELKKTLIYRRNIGIDIRASENIIEAAEEGLKDLQ